MKLWRVLAHANGQRVLTRLAVGIINKNLQSTPYRRLSYVALSCSNGAEGEQFEERSQQTRGSWSPHVFGLVSVSLLLCGGRKGN